MEPTIILTLAGAVLAGGTSLYFVKKSMSENKIKNAEALAKKTLDDAERQKRNIIKNAERDAQSAQDRARNQAEKERQEQQRQLDHLEKLLEKKEREIDSRSESIEGTKKDLEEKLERIKELRSQQETILEELKTHLENAASLTKEEAEKLLMASVEKETRARAGAMIKEIEDQAKKVSDRKAKEIVLEAIERTATDTVTSSTTSIVMLPDEEMKGRIIGREGRNIRAFESATGVDVIIDDTPNGVIISAFDPIRREIARIALEKLLKDGRIHPTRVEEAVEKARKELQEIIIETGERASDELGLKFHPKLVEMIGRLKYRTSYGQNILEHALEAARIAAVMAGRLGVNVELAKRGAMLHDIGKAIDFEQEGTHDDLGAEACRKYGESDELINCIMAHHEDEEPDTVEAVIVKVADAISSVRPGARRESVELYLKRLESLEKIASGFEGVEKAYAIQAGREVRVLVRPDQIDDVGMIKVAQDIAKQIEEEVDYPGEVTVSLVRETRATGVAH